MREIGFRAIAGLLAVGVVGLSVVLLLSGDLTLASIGWARGLGLIVMESVLASYAVGGAERTFPRAQHVLWLIDFPEQAWGWLTGRSPTEALSWSSGSTGANADVSGSTDPGSSSEAESERPPAAELLVLHDELDTLREAPSAVGIPGLLLVLGLFVVVLTSADLGVLVSLGVTLLLSVPAWPLFIKDLSRARRTRRVEAAIGSLQFEAPTEDVLLPPALGGEERGDDDGALVGDP